MMNKPQTFHGGERNLLLIFHFNMKDRFTSLQPFICISKWQHEGKCVFYKRLFSFVEVIAA